MRSTHGCSSFEGLDRRKISTVKVNTDTFIHFFFCQNADFYVLKQNKEYWRDYLIADTLHSKNWLEPNTSDIRIGFVSLSKHSIAIEKAVINHEFHGQLNAIQINCGLKQKTGPNAYHAMATGTKSIFFSVHVHCTRECTVQVHCQSQWHQFRYNHHFDGNNYYLFSTMRTKQSHYSITCHSLVQSQW